MLKGIQKNAIWMRTAGNRYFEGAYFILRADAPAVPPVRQNEMIREANRILSENRVLHSKKGTPPRRGGSRAVPFLGGALFGALSVLVCWIFVLLFA